MTITLRKAAVPMAAAGVLTLGGAAPAGAKILLGSVPPGPPFEVGSPHGAAVTVCLASAQSPGAGVQTPNGGFHGNDGFGSC